MQYADVILPLATPPMTFAVEEQMCLRLRVGMRVMVQLGARKFYSGIVWRLHDNRPPYERIKSIVSIIDEQMAVLPEQLRLWEWIANYYMCPLGMVMQAALPAKLADGYSEQETLHGGIIRLRFRMWDWLMRSIAKRSCMPCWIGWGGPKHNTKR